MTRRPRKRYDGSPYVRQAPWPARIIESIVAAPTLAAAARDMGYQDYAGLKVRMRTIGIKAARLADCPLIISRNVDVVGT